MLTGPGPSAQLAISRAGKREENPKSKPDPIANTAPSFRGRRLAPDFRMDHHARAPIQSAWRRALIAVKVTLGAGLALLTMNLIAIRMFNIPSVPNPVFGDVHEPGKRFRQQIEGDGSGIWTSNCVRRACLPNAGQKPVLLVLGDSYTEAAQVKDEDHFAHLLEQQLGGIPVLAVGRPGYSVADYVAGAATFKRLFSPDWVIIQVGAGDFQADAWTKKEGGYARFEREEPSGRDQTEKATRTTGGSTAALGSLKIVSLPPSQPGWFSTVVREKCTFWFPLVTFAYLRKSEAKDWMEGHNEPWFHARAASFREEGRPKEEMGQYPLDDEMKLLAEAYERRLTLLYLPKFDPKDPLKEMEIEKVLKGLAEKNGVRFVSLRERFPELAATGQAPYGFDNTLFNEGHWNRYGHQAAAQLLVEECRKLEVRQ